MQRLKERSGWYDPRVMAALEAAMVTEGTWQSRSVTLRELKEDMVLAQDVKSLHGLLLIAKGHEVSRPMLERLTTIGQTSGIHEPIEV